MSLSEWLDFGRNLLLSGVIVSLLVGIYKAGRWHGTATEKLDHLGDSFDRFATRNHEDHERIEGSLDKHGNRLTAVETEMKNVCVNKREP